MNTDIGPKTLEQERERGRKAQEVLEHPLYQEAWAKVGEALAVQRRKCPVKDVDLASRLVLSEQMLLAARGYLEEIMTTGRMAEIQLAEREEAKKRSLLARAVGLR